MPVASAPHPTAGHSWHWVAPCRKNRESSKKEKKKTTKKTACPGHACYSRGSREQTVGDSRAGASGKQASLCEAPAALRAGFVQPRPGVGDWNTPQHPQHSVLGTEATEARMGRLQPRSEGFVPVLISWVNLVVRWASTGGFMQGTCWWPQGRGADVLLLHVACGEHLQKEG